MFSEKAIYDVPAPICFIPFRYLCNILYITALVYSVWQWILSFKCMNKVYKTMYEVNILSEGLRYENEQNQLSSVKFYIRR